MNAGPMRAPTYPSVVTIVNATLGEVPGSLPDELNRMGTILEAPRPIKQKPASSEYGKPAYTTITKPQAARKLPAWKIKKTELRLMMLSPKSLPSAMLMEKKA